MVATIRRTTVTKIINPATGYKVKVSLKFDTETEGYACDVTSGDAEAMDGIGMSVKNVSISGLDSFAEGCKYLIGGEIRQYIAEAVSKIGAHTL